jgi:hypothetical protein
MLDCRCAKVNLPWWTVLASVIGFLQINYIFFGQSTITFCLNYTCMYIYCFSKDWNIDIFFGSTDISSRWSGFKGHKFAVDGIAFYLPWWTAKTFIIRFAAHVPLFLGVGLAGKLRAQDGLGLYTLGTGFFGPGILISKIGLGLGFY